MGSDYGDPAAFFEKSMGAYAAYMTAYAEVGGRYRREFKYDIRHWQAVARLCIDKCAKPEEVVAARFRAARPELRIQLKPADMHSAEAKRSLDKLKPDNHREVEKAWDIMAARARSSKTKSVVEVLRDHYYPFEAWFRVVFPDEPDARIIEIYGAAALDQYQSSLSLKMFLEAKHADRIGRFLNAV